MYNDRSNQHNVIDGSMFIPSLSKYEEFAEGLIRLAGYLARTVVYVFSTLSRAFR